MVHCISLCTRWCAQRSRVSELLGVCAEDGAQPFALACLRGDVRLEVFEAMVMWFSELNREKFAFWVS